MQRGKSVSLFADELPERWCVSTIDELCELNPKHDSSLKANLQVSFVPMASVSEVDGRITTPEVRPFGEVKKGYTHFADGDVILAKITPCMENGKAASVRGLVNGLACGTTEFFVFRSRGGIDQDYLFKFIRQESFRRAARATMQSGVGQARVPKEFVLGTEIPLPPLPEQRRIVAKIEALQSHSRKTREALEAIPPLLEQFRQCRSWPPPSEATSPPTGVSSIPKSNQPACSSTASEPNAAANGKSRNSPSSKPRGKCPKMIPGKTATSNLNPSMTPTCRKYPRDGVGRVLIRSVF